MSRSVSILACLVALLLSSAAGTACASVVLGEVVWNDGGDLEGWTENQSYVDLTNPSGGGPGGGGDGYLDIDFTATGAGSEETLVFTDDPSSIFAGAWTSEMWVELDFWAQDLAPDSLEVRFSSTTGSDVWRYELTPIAGTDWEHYVASFTYDDWIFNDGLSSGSEAQFLSDLGSLDWIGIYISDGDTAENDYGLDNFQLMVPEPAEYALAVSALVVTWLSVRRRRKQKPAVQVA